MSKRLHWDRSLIHTHLAAISNVGIICTLHSLGVPASVYTSFYKHVKSQLILCKKVGHCVQMIEDNRD